MAIILPFGDGATKITDFEITAVCTDEPTREDPSIGTFPGYSAEMLAALPEEAKFPYIGNGLYEPAVYGSMVQFRTIQDSSHFQNFIMGISTAGYNPTNVIQGTYIFQKAASGSMFYTIYMLEPQYFGDMTLLMVAYAGLQPSMAPASGWPADTLASRFNDANFISVISIDPGVLPEDTTYVCMDDPEDSSEFIIQATSNLPTSYASTKALLPVVKAYISTLQSFGYMLDSSSESDVEDDERLYCSYTLFAPDIEHYIAIIITFSNGQFHFQVVFCEKAKTLLDVDEIIETYCQDIFPHTGFGARNYFAQISSSPTSNYFNLLTNEISAEEVEEYYNNVTYSNKSKVELTNYIRYTFYSYDVGYMYYEIRVYTDHVTIYFDAENIK